MDLLTLQKELQRIQKLGFVPTHRAGDTGIGKTLEDLLDIKENNVPHPPSPICYGPLHSVAFQFY